MDVAEPLVTHIVLLRLMVKLLEESWQDINRQVFIKFPEIWAKDKVIYYVL
jgi:hypothetical protein